MKILALHLINHDANICYYDGEKATYLNLERTKGIKKYHYYKWDMAKLADDLAGLNIPLHLDAIIITCGELVSSPEEEASMNWQFTEDKLFREISEDTFATVHGNIPYTADKYYRVEHHYGHYMGAQWLYNNTSGGVVIDGCGDYLVHTSVFKDTTRIKTYDMNEMVSIGDLYFDTSADLLGRGRKDQWVNTFVDRSGNLMGLISYGNFNETYANHLRQYSFKDFPGEAVNRWKYISKSGYAEATMYGHGYDAKSKDRRTKTEIGKKYPMSMVHAHPDGYPYVNQWHLDWMYTWQTVLGEKLVEFFSEYFHKDDEFVYTGGVAHNVVINEVLNKAFPNMKIPPSIGDEGQSLGAMYAYLYHNEIKAPACPTTNWQSENIPMMNSEAVSIVADYLISNNIVAVCQGESHIGPRALGNRSLIYLPDRKYAAHYFNERNLKQREWWRPYGIIILEEELENYLQTTVKSPYMLHVATPTEEGMKKLSGVVHVDGTVRYQTVSDGPYAELLKRLRLMGAPAAVVNTSLNAPGKPMCHTIGDARAFTEEFGPDVLVLGDDVYKTDHRGVLWSRN